MIHSFLLIGQSNMGGRGYINEVTPIHNEHLLVLRNGRWRQMYQPVNPDRVTSGINLVESFADRYAKDHDVDVGIIPCADGGTCLDQWCVGSLLFDHACYMAKLAQRTSTIAAVLWHQGESDCRLQEDFDAYPERFLTILTEFRNRIGRPDLPIVIGEISNHISDRWGRLAGYQKLNDTLHELANKLPNCAIVECGEFPLKPDGIHFNAESLRTIGNLYFEKYQELVQK